MSKDESKILNILKSKMTHVFGFLLKMLKNQEKMAKKAVGESFASLFFLLYTREKLYIFYNINLEKKPSQMTHPIFH